MPSNRLFSALFVGIPDSRGEGDIERELDQLQKKRDADIDFATLPINRRYEQALDRLLRRAMDAKDVDAAVKIEAALSMQPSRIAQDLAGDWELRASSGYRTTITFRLNGTGRRSDSGEFKWIIRGTTLYLAGSPEDAADKFLLPFKDGGLTGVNAIGNGLILTPKK